MAKLSPKRAAIPQLPGLKLIGRGKVRDSYVLEGGKILQVATDAISIFDFVLNATVPLKGVILTAMSVFWFKKMEEYGIKTHLVAYGAEIDEHLPEHLRGNADLQSRALVVKNLQMVPNVEFIVRNCLTGSALGPYAETGMVCGHAIVPGLEDGDLLPCLLDTPSTKADEGHDEHRRADEVRRLYHEQTYTALKIFQIAREYALSRGIVLADTKFEFALDGTWADEAITPDSSRFWSEDEWRKSRAKKDGRKAPTAFDKQFVRAWGIAQRINKLDPKNSADINAVHTIEVPDRVIAKTAQIYRYIFWRLTGHTIERYLENTFNVSVPFPQKTVAIVCGSESDLPMVKDVLALYGSNKPVVDVHVMSCHRNPVEVFNFAKDGCGGADVVIGIGGKALALPGMIDAIARAHGHDIPVIGVALGELGSASLEAARLSIEEVPGAPLVIDEFNNSAYMLEDGLMDALDRVLYGELPPSPARTEKPVQMNVWSNE